VLFAQYDALREVRKRARRELAAEARRHEATRWLASCPGMGTVRVAQTPSVVVSPERASARAGSSGRTSAWPSSCARPRTGCAMREGGPLGARAGRQHPRGLNRNGNRTLKQVFKGAATTVIQQRPDDPLYTYYERLLANGTKPTLAKVSLARKIAATALAMWKHKAGSTTRRSPRSRRHSSSRVPARCVATGVVDAFAAEARAESGSEGSIHWMTGRGLPRGHARRAARSPHG
jgi:hypothetical protein